MASPDPSSPSSERRRLRWRWGLTGVGITGAVVASWYFLLRIPEPDEVCDALWASVERRPGRRPWWASAATGPDGEARYREFCLQQLERIRPDELPLWPSQNPGLSYEAVARCVVSARNDIAVDECIDDTFGRQLWLPSLYEEPVEQAEPELPLAAEPIEIVDVALLDAPYFEQTSLRPTRTLVTGKSLSLAPVHDLPAHRALVQLENLPPDQLHTVLYDTRTGEELAHINRVVLVQRQQRIAEIRRLGTGELGILELDSDRIAYPQPSLPGGYGPEQLRLALFDGPVSWGVLFGRRAGGPTYYAIWELREEPPALLDQPFPYWPKERHEAGTFEIEVEEGEPPRGCHSVCFTPTKQTVCDDRHDIMVDGTAVFPGGRLGPSRPEARCVGECVGNDERNLDASFAHWFAGDRFIHTVTAWDTRESTVYIWSPEGVVSWRPGREITMAGVYSHGGLINPSRKTPAETTEWVDLARSRLLRTEPLLPVGWVDARPERTLVVRPGDDDSMMVLDARQATLDPVAPDLDCPGLRPVVTAEGYGGFRCDRGDAPRWSRLVDYDRRRVVHASLATELEMDAVGCVVASDPRRIVVGCPGPAQ
ncbi:MAG: hypothetical protein H6712_20260 [Myxococcales bacterium]|nr:hypothetical protein [Myxococcales bacterium]